MLAETIQLIQSDTGRMECLEAVDALGLPGDAGLLQIAAHRFFVGDRVPPEIADVYHARDANLLTVVRWILDRLDAGAGSPA